MSCDNLRDPRSRDLVMAMRWFTYACLGHQGLEDIMELLPPEAEPAKLYARIPGENQLLEDPATEKPITTTEVFIDDAD